MKAKSTVKMNFPRIQQLSKAAVTALAMTGEAVHSDVVQSQVVPFKTGNLQNESAFVDDSDADRGVVRLIHSTPYARRLYYHPEFNFDTSENPNAKGQWFEDWEKGGEKEDFAKNAFMKFYKERGDV
jgi:hypothetical protein